jgi:hypothetical protein
LSGWANGGSHLESQKPWSGADIEDAFPELELEGIEHCLAPRSGFLGLVEGFEGLDNWFVELHAFVDRHLLGFR